ncbi:DNA adenine methylase [Thermovibrio sp.]
MELLRAGVKPRPFVKWAGGKRQILKHLLFYAPKEFNRYFEPFVGGGALFFELSPKRAVISDLNAELINAYRVIKGQVEELIESLKKHKNNEEYYYRIRSLKPAELSPVERASRFIYLNKTCFNGLYRENSKGEFNVPFGRYKRPKICDEENLRAVSEFLNSVEVEILNADYGEVCKRAEAGDFIYLDPPYIPVSKTAGFTTYTGGGFGEEDHRKLAEVFRELSEKGCFVMLSNADHPLIRELYRDFKLIEITTNRAISCKRSKRKGSGRELLIMNY